MKNLRSCKKFKKIFHDWFQRKCQKNLNFWHLRREGGSSAKKMIFLLDWTSYRAISLVSKMGSFFSQLAAVFILRTEKWGMVIKNFQRMGHFSCFQLHFFQLWKAKLGKYKKVEEKWLFIPFPLIFCYNLAKNQLPNTFFVKIMEIFHFLTP